MMWESAYIVTGTTVVRPDHYLEAMDFSPFKLPDFGLSYHAGQRAIEREREIQTAPSAEESARLFGVELRRRFQLWQDVRAQISQSKPLPIRIGQMLNGTETAIVIKTHNQWVYKRKTYWFDDILICVLPKGKTMQDMLNSNISNTEACCCAVRQK